MRLHKYLAKQGIGSLRACEKYIEQGLIKVNGKTVTAMGVQVDPTQDHIEVASEVKQRLQKFSYYAFHKPVGYVCAVSGPEEPKIIKFFTKIPEKVFPIGRLDKLSSGLLLLTDDGRFATAMADPRFEKEKEYVVKVREKIIPSAIQKLEESFFIRGKKTRPVQVHLQGPHRMSVILCEGRNRQIRRMCERAGLHVEQLIRIRIGSIHLGDLPPGNVRKIPQHTTSSSLPEPILQQGQNPAE